MDIVPRLCELRRLSGYTRREAAELAGMDLETLSAFENGEEIENMKLFPFLTLLSVYGVTPAEFFAGRGTEPRLRAV
jgi:transcriptional regulator with XRE-family HTH domain